ncbi:kelch-like protein 3 isoform X6 [Cephus cinctus]|uniref:Kelch-like protein 3 isoform X6 n=1 Tax=Cephus cinctus TaxID=211228 RepID=A0AAJ7RKJ2_CEPCN|nr:kelch-like protein 3 isoform X6 [Cephus cinctus]
MNSTKRLFLKYVFRENGKHVLLYRSDHLPDGKLRMLSEMPKDVILVADVDLAVPANKMVLAASSLIFRVTVLEGKIYAVGGCNLTEAPLRTMHVYDVSADHWSACTGMKIKRMNFGVVTLDDCIYAVWSYIIGGRDQKTIYSSAEVYNPKTCKWTIIPPMNVARSFFTVAVLNGRIYVIGGFAGKDKLPLSSVECYNPETGQWIFVADLNIRRQTASAGVLKGILYVVGGAVAITNVLKSVEVFDPNTNIWTFIEEMPGPRHHAGVVCLNEELYVVGGSDGTVDLRSICVYNPKKRAWIIYPTYMSIGRSQGGVIAVDIPHNYI